MKRTNPVLTLLRSRRFWLTATLIGLGLVTQLSPFRFLLAADWLIQGFSQLMGPWRILAFLLAHLFATVLGIPGTVLVIGGGAVFGLVWGTLWSVIGATLGAIAAFGIARYCLHRWFKQRFQGHPTFQRFNRMMCRNALACVLAIRFAPISPFNLVNFWFGLTPMPIKPYAIGTLIGIIPGTMAYTWLGVAGLQAFKGNGWPLAIALSLLALLSALPLMARHIWQN